MKRAVPLTLIFLVTASGLWFLSPLLTASSTRTPDPKMPLIAPKAQKASIASGVKQTPSSVLPPPVVACESPEFEFGAMDPHDNGEHIFVIQNKGKGPLKLVQGVVSCECTFSNVVNGVVPPGGEGQVRLGWNTGEKPGLFVQAAEILTNDPEFPAVRLVIRGTVQTHIGFEPRQIIMPSLRAGESKTVVTTIYSHVYDHFSITGHKTTHPGWKCEIEPASADKLAELNAKAGYTLRLTSPKDLPHGGFQELLRLDIETDPSAETKLPYGAYELPISGRIVGGYALFGKNIDSRGLLDLGFLTHGKGWKHTVRLRLRDKETQLSVKRIRVKPDFLKVEVTQDDSKDIQPGRYLVYVEIPRDAQPGNYANYQQGEIVIETDHPRVREVRFHIGFVIKSPQ